MNTPGTAANSDARKRNAENRRGPAVSDPVRAASEAEVEAVAQALAQMARETIAAMDAVRAREAEIKAEGWGDQ